MIGDPAAALREVTGVGAVVMNSSGQARGLKGLEERAGLLFGSLDGPVPMNDAACVADLPGGRKTGLFHDQRPDHALAQRLARGQAVPDVFSHIGFSHIGGFGLAATGAEVWLDTRQGDAFAVMEALARMRLGLVVRGPPAFAPALAAGLRACKRVARRAAPLVAPGGCLCSCSHAADPGAFPNASARRIGRAGRPMRLIHTGFAGQDHPMLPQRAESGCPKALFFRPGG